MRIISERKHIKLLLLFLAGTLGAVISWNASADPEVQSESATASMPVQTISVSRSQIQSTETFSGFVRGIRHADISPKVSGSVIALLKEPGDSVQFGDLLAILDGNELIAGNQSASISLSAALTSLDRMEKYTKQQVDAAETALSKTKDDRKRGIATNKDVRVAEDAVRTAKKSRDTENAQAAASVAALQGSETISRAALENRFVRAPFSGIVAAKQTSVGSFASPNSVLYSLVSPNDIEIPVSVPIRLAASIQKGASVSILPEHSNQSIDGEVFSIAPVANPSTGETVATIRPRAHDDPSSTMFLGQYASVELPTEPLRDTLLIPDSALIRQYGETFVFTVTGSKAHKQPVVAGNQYGNSREILNGLDIGDTVITEGLHALQEGMPVHVIHHE